MCVSNERKPEGRLLTVSVSANASSTIPLSISPSPSLFFYFLFLLQHSHIQHSLQQPVVCNVCCSLMWDACVLTNYSEQRGGNYTTKRERLKKKDRLMAKEILSILYNLTPIKHLWKNVMLSVSHSFQNEPSISTFISNLNLLKNTQNNYCLLHWQRQHVDE